MNGLLPMHWKNKKDMTQHSTAPVEHSWKLRPRTILLLLLLVFTLQSIFWLSEHLAVDQQLNNQKLEINSLRLEVLKLTAKVEESGVRLIRHGKWLEDHLNTFTLLQGQGQGNRQGEDKHHNKMDEKKQRASNVTVTKSKKMDTQIEDVKMVVGILSAKRETPTVLKMVRNLVKDLNMNQFKVLLYNEMIVLCIHC